MFSKYFNEKNHSKARAHVSHQKYLHHAFSNETRAIIHYVYSDLCSKKGADIFEL